VNNSAAFLPQPYTHVVLHACKYIDGLNRKCSHNCLFCFENIDLEKSCKILPSIKMIEEVFADIYKHNKKYGIDKLENIYIAGGEPTMREDIFDIIELASQMAHNTFLSSHADYEQPDILIPKLKKVGITNISISLHGHNPETHEFVTRTKGSFENTMRSINICLSKNIEVSLNCVVTALNINSILDLLKMLNEKFSGINDITFTHYWHSGIACEHIVLDFNPFNFSGEIKRALDFAEKCQFSVRFRDFPLCLDQRLVNRNLDVSQYFVIIWSDLDPSVYRLYSEQAGKTFLPKCKCCVLQKQCAGVLTSNLYKYDKYTDWGKLDEYQIRE
jgi:MoaA/NifB/PqqE/SkfB family radical SAM enzyme